MTSGTIPALDRPTATSTAGGGLGDLSVELSRQREVLRYPDAVWTRGFAPAGVLDVLIIGAGQSAIACASKLRREGVGELLLVDRSTPGREGPWLDWARMRTLRTPADLHGADGGVPAATFAHWYAHSFGEAAWEALDLIPRDVWARYLAWLRAELDLPVLSRTRVLEVAPGPHGLTVTTLGPDGARRRHEARRVIAATGMSGAGGPYVPDLLRDLPRRHWVHSSDVFDGQVLAGRRVLVIGGGASAFDNAATALEHGAALVRHVIRRADPPTINSMRTMEFRGLIRHFQALPDDVKLAFTRRTLSLPMPPPDHSIERCRIHPQYRLEYGRWASAVHSAGDEVSVTFADGREEHFDLIIAATGFTVDLDRVPWLSELAGDITRWGDRARLTAGAVDARLARYPYLGPGMQALARDGDPHHPVTNLFLYNPAALASAGPASHGMNTLAFGSDLVVEAVTRSLFLAQAPEHLKTHEAGSSPPGRPGGRTLGGSGTGRLSSLP